MFTLKNYFYKNYSNYQILKTIKCISFFTGLQNMSFATFHVFEDSCFLVFYNVFKMECYATPWPLWRESRNLLHFIEPSFAFGASLSLFLPHCSLFSFPFRRVCARLQARGLARGTAISAFTRLKRMKKEQGLFNKGGNCNLQFPPLLNNLSLCAPFCSA